MKTRTERQLPEQTRTNRRSFIAGAGAGMLGAGVLGVGDALSAAPAFAKGSLSHGDAAILRFLSAAEILENDLWQQYNELCGIQDREVPGGSGNKAFTKALTQLDSDMAQYVHDNTEDEFTHFAFLNAYLRSRGRIRSISISSGRCRAVRQPAPRTVSASQT